MASWKYKSNKKGQAEDFGSDLMFALIIFLIALGLVHYMKINLDVDNRAVFEDSYRSTFDAETLSVVRSYWLSSDVGLDEVIALISKSKSKDDLPSSSAVWRSVKDDLVQSESGVFLCKPGGEFHDLFSRGLNGRYWSMVVFDSSNDESRFACSSRRMPDYRQNKLIDIGSSDLGAYIFPVPGDPYPYKKTPILRYSTHFFQETWESKGWIIIELKLPKPDGKGYLIYVFAVGGKKK